jgi:hypothetical protein
MSSGSAEDATDVERRFAACRNLLDAQTGKSLSAADAALLKSLSLALG